LDKKLRSVALPVSGGEKQPEGGTPHGGGTPDGATSDLWYAEGLRFSCTQCGNCCSGGPGYVWVTVEDMGRIAGYLKMGFEDFTRKYVRQIGEKYSLVEKFNYDCAFLTREGGKTGCSIYPVRPTQCRTWPFWDENLKSPAAWKAGSRRGGGCAGMCDSGGKLYDVEHIERCRKDPGSPH
jgi:uncharacterized protein